MSALGNRMGEPKTAELVPVLFNVNATTTYGDVGLRPGGFVADH